MIGRIGLVLLSFLSLVTVPTSAQAIGYSDYCPGGTAPWTGTQEGPSAPVVVSSQQDVTCTTPEVPKQTGSTTHAATYQSWQAPKNGDPCTQYLDSDVHLGPLAGTTRDASWYDPTAVSADGIMHMAVVDRPAGLRSLSMADGTTVPVAQASAVMGNGSLTIRFVQNGTWSMPTRSCVGPWTVPASAPFGRNCSTQCGPVAALHIARDLPYTPMPKAQATSLVASARGKYEQVYSGGQVTADKDPLGVDVHVPVCFGEGNANVPPTVGFSIKVPQAAAGGRALVVNYVVQAVIDQSWWDFSEPENPVTVQQGGPASSSCEVQHTFGHVSADAYGSSHLHHPPPGVAWTFGDTEPAPDMEAVEVWHHVHLSVVGYWQQPNGQQYAQVLPVTSADDFWLPGRVLFIRVNQIEPVPFVP